MITQEQFPRSRSKIDNTVAGLGAQAESVYASPPSIGLCGIPYGMMNRDLGFAGVYVRMEASDPTKPFRNGMNLTIDGPVATLRIPGYSNYVPKRVEITEVSGSGNAFTLDWRRHNESWESAQFEATIVNGVVGLTEKGSFFWKRQDPHGALRCQRQ